MKSAFPVIVIVCALLCIRQTVYSLTTPTSNEDAPTVLKTQDFESGEKEMSKVNAESLETFLQDLNQRKDWDYANHNGQPGPDSAYLFKWVVRTTAELQHRGYYFDAAGQLRRPGTLVPVR